MSLKAKYEREPTFYERYEIARTLTEVYSNFNVTAKYSKHVEKAVLSQALRNVLLKNPGLVMNFFRKEGCHDDVKEQGKNFIKKPIQKVSFDQLVTYKKLEGSFDQTVLSEFNEIVFGFDKEAPLWNLIVSDSEGPQYFTFICNHIIGDANTACFFHEDLVNEIVQVQSSDKKDVQLEILFDYSNDKSSLPDFPKATADLIPELYSPSLWFTVSTVVEKLLLPKFVTNLVSKYVYLHDLQKYPMFSNGEAKLHAKANYRIVNVDASVTKVLLPSLRAKKVTFTPYFCAVALQTLQEVVFSCISKQKYSTNLSIIVNGRRYYPKLHDQLKYNTVVSVCEVVQKPIPSSKSIDGLLEPIKYMSDSIIRSVESRDGFKLVGLLKIINFWDFLLSKVGKTDLGTMELSNIGNKSIKSGDLEVVDLIFSQDNGLSTHVIFSAVSTPAGGINVVVGFNDELEKLILSDSNEKAMDVFARELKTRLIEYAQ